MQSPLLASLTGYWAGAFQPLPAAPRFSVEDPATGVLLAELPTMGAPEAEAAVASAVEFQAQPAPSLARRRAWLHAIADAQEAHGEELARLITAENGKPLGQSRGEVAYAAAFYRQAARELSALEPRVLEERPRDHRWEVHARPAGVAGLITPWNFPLAMLAKKLAGAIGAGCASVLKPSELTPLTCIAFFALLDGLGLPQGLVNLVFGDAPAIGAVLSRHRAVRVISFTGSTRVGRLLLAQSAPQVKKLSLELGGNAPFVVFGDADPERVLDQLLANKFRCSGQTCVCTNRLFMARSVADGLLARLRSRLAQLSVGPGAEGCDIGPMIELRAAERVRALLAGAEEAGARVERFGVGRFGIGVEGTAASPRFVPPTLVTGASDEMALAREELFGPVISVLLFDDDDEDGIVRRANDTDHGLAAYLFGADEARLRRVAARLHFGHVGINSATGPTPETPFGGMWQSGLGREGGVEGVLEFVEWQTLPVWGT